MPVINRRQETFDFELDDAYKPAKITDTGLHFIRIIERKTRHDSREHSPKPYIKATNEKGKIIGIAFLVELTELGGREKLSKYKIATVLKY